MKKQTDQNKQTKLPKRTVLASALVLICIPIVIALGILLLEDRSYYLISLIIVVLSLLPFMLVFEGRKPKARELVVIAVLVGIAVAGRAAFFFAPQFKPVAAIVIIAAVCFGGEAGFMVGALSAFLSNFFFGQGPWTPWQMLAYGIIGLLAGILFQKGMLPKKKVPLCIFGAVATLFIYGLLLDISSALMVVSTPTWPMLLTYFATGLPFNIIHAVATVFFLLVLSKPMIEKLDRVKKKFGFLEPGQ